MIIDWTAGAYAQLGRYQDNQGWTYSLAASAAVLITYGIQKTRRAWSRARGRI